MRLRYLVPILFCAAAFGQGVVVLPKTTVLAKTAVSPGVAASGATYTFVAYTYCPEVAGSNASITTASCAASGGTLSLSSGDLVVVACRAGAASIASDHGSDGTNAYSFLTVQNTQGGTWQVSYVLSSTATGATNFTCTPATSSTFQSLIALQYHVSGSGTFDTQTGTTAASGTTITSPSFTTTGNDLVVYCATINSGSQVWAVSTIGGVTATLRGVSNSSAGAGADSGCEDNIFGSTQSGITAAITGNTNTAFPGATVAAFK